MRIFRKLFKFNLANFTLFALGAGGAGLLFFGGSPALADAGCPVNDICGAVTDSSSVPIPNVPVEAFASGDVQNNGWNFGHFLASTNSGTDGSYTLTGLSPGSYILVFNDFTNPGSKPNFTWQYNGGQHQIEKVTPVTLNPGQFLSGIKASLSPAGFIQGAVTNLSGSTPLSHVQVLAYDASNDDFFNNDVASSAVTKANGTYSMSELSAGKYFLLFKDSHGNYVSQLYNGADGLMMWMGQDALPVWVTAGLPAAQANPVKMSLPGTLNGRVTDQTGAAVPNIGVTVYFASAGDIGGPAENTTTDDNGFYSFADLPANSYHIEFNGTYSNSYDPNYPDLFYGHTLDINSSTPVTVNESQTTTTDMTLNLLVSSTTTVTSSAPTAKVGQEVTYTVTVTPGNTSFGRVTMFDGDQLLPGCMFNPINNGVVICKVTYVSAGNHSITAQYHSGDVYQDSTSAPLIETVTGSISDLKGANLVGANLAQADLSGVNLSGMDLTGANLTSANLTGANLKNATLKGADFSNSNLTDSNLKGATLAGTNLTSADLSNANLMGVDLSGANLADANLTDANLKNANLSYATITGADLTGANTKDANLTGVIR